MSNHRNEDSPKRQRGRPGPRPRFELLRALGQLIHSWWYGDRIRAAPTDGRLLRLEPGWRLLIGPEPAEVVARTVHGPLDGVRIVYACRLGRGQGSLIVQPDVKEIWWLQEGQTTQLAEVDIEVFPGSS